MIRSRVRQKLSTLSVSEYVAAQRRVGRSSLTPAFVQQWADQHKFATSMLKRSRLSPEVKQAMILLREITYPIAMQARSAIPYYYPYTCVNVLDWYMEDCGKDPAKLTRKSVLGIVALLLDLAKFEMHSLIGCESAQPLHFEPELAVQRIRMLKEVYDATAPLREPIPGYISQLTTAPRHYENLIDYTSDSDRIGGLVQLSCIPQTQFHDEVLFLRSIHISELCFYGLRVATIRAKEEILRGAFDNARTRFEEAIAFAEILRHIFQVVRTMPLQHFLDFRSSAANASAVQSANYQLLEIQLFGLSDHKLALFERIPHLRNLRRYYHPGFISLRDVLAPLPATRNTDELESMLEAARRLDSKLLTWRGLHVSFAKFYLSDIPIGTGGTSGAAYLKTFLRNTLFGQTTIDPELAQELAESGDHPDANFAGIDLHIAPPRELIGLDTVIDPEAAD